MVINCIGDSVMIRCQLCGFQFEEGGQTICTSCPLNKGCELICCPNCGYQIPPEPTVFKMFKRVFNKKEKKKQADDV